MKTNLSRWLVLFVIGLASCLVAFRAFRDNPVFGHAVFGPDGASRLRFIVLGKQIYLDRNVDDVPQRSEFVGKFRIQEPIELVDPDSPTDYVVTGGLLFVPQAVGVTQPQVLDLQVAIRGATEYRQTGGPVMAASPLQAGVAHFHGPLSVDLRMREELCLRPGGNPTNIRIALRTYQPGEDAFRHTDFRSTAAVCSNIRGDRNQYAFPQGIVPELELEFLSQSTPDMPTKKRFALDQFC